MAAFHFQYLTSIKEQLKSNFYFLFIILISCNIGCNKVESPLSIELIDTNTSDDLLKLSNSTNNTLLIVGGSTWFSGIVLNYDNKKTSTILSNGITFLNVKFDPFGNNFAAIGLNGNYFQVDSTVNDFSNANFQVNRDILFGPESDITVGGKSYSNGFIVKTAKQKQILSTFKFPSELRAIEKINNNLFAVGFGSILLSTDQGETWIKTPYEGDFFIAIAKINEEKAFIVGQENTIFFTENGGNTWRKLKAPKNEQINNARHLDGKLYLFCDDGIIKILPDTSSDWQIYKINDININDGIHTKDGLLIIGENGYAAVVNLD